MSEVVQERKEAGPVPEGISATRLGTASTEYHVRSGRYIITVRVFEVGSRPRVDGVIVPDDFCAGGKIFTKGLITWNAWSRYKGYETKRERLGKFLYGIESAVRDIRYKVQHPTSKKRSTLAP